MQLQRCPPIQRRSAAPSTVCDGCGAKLPVPLGERFVYCIGCKHLTSVIQDSSKQAVERPQPQAVEQPQDSSKQADERPHPQAVQLRHPQAVQRPQRQAVERKQPQGRATMCSRCGLYLSVPRDASFVHCALCHAMTRVQRRTSGLEDFLKGMIYNLMSPPEPPPSISSSEDRLPASYPRVPGRKRALLVGIAYTGTKYELKGTVDDINNMSSLLIERFSFPSDSILVLTEEEKNPDRVPTMKNLLLAMRWLVQDCNTGDALSLVFHFSGHAFDKALWAVDFEDGGKIPDNQINNTMVRPLGSGVKLHAFVDTDHSGSDAVVLDLPYRLSLMRTGSTGRFLWVDQKRISRPTGTKGGLAISISGCRDSQNQAKYPASASSVGGGAMTYNLIKAVESTPATTYGQLIHAIRAGTRREPQLSATETFAIYGKPFLL